MSSRFQKAIFCGLPPASLTLGSRLCSGPDRTPPRRHPLARRSRVRTTLSVVADVVVAAVNSRAPRGINSSLSPSGSVGVRRIVPCACRNGRGRPSSSPSRLSASPRAEETNWLSYIAASAAQVRASSKAVTSRILRIADPEVRSTSLPNTVRARASFSASRRAKGLGTNPRQSGRSPGRRWCGPVPRRPQGCPPCDRHVSHSGPPSRDRVSRSRRSPSRTPP